MDQTNLQVIWAEILDKTRESLAEAACKKWLSPLKPLSLSETTLELGVQNEFASEWITSHYFGILQDATNVIINAPNTIHIKLTITEPEHPEQVTLLDADGDTAAETKVEAAPETSASTSKAEKAKKNGQPETKTPPAADTDDNPLQVIAPGDASSLNPRYTFETFVTGSSNQLAHAAAEGVAKEPGKVFNPLFMYGGVGLGKTHLMHAIGNKVLRDHPNMRVLYVTSEKFTNELIDSIRSGHPERFRAKYRKIDVLMIDDIQFISGKDSTQTEFFNTFNELKDAEKAIVISSDRPPKELEQLEERLRSRFEGGMLADVQPPDFEMRIGILRNKAQMDHYSVPDSVIDYIANHIDSNIRELEGALTRLVAYASLMQKPITPELAAEALKDILPESHKKVVTMELIQEIVASYFKVKLEDLHSKKRNQRIAYPRQVAMYLSRELTDTSLPQIGQFFGGRDHSTVLHAYNKVSDDRQNDAKIAKTINDILNRIQKM